MPAHRESIRAPGAPEAVGPYVHAVRTSGDLLFCSGQIPLDPKTGDLVGATAADQAGRCLENLAAVCDAAGTTLGDAVRLTVYLTDMARSLRSTRCTSRSSNPIRRRASRSPSRGCRAARWSRSTRWWRSLTDTAQPPGASRARVSRRRRPPRRRGDRRDRPRDAGAQLPHAERARRRDRRAQGREPPADGLVQAARRVHEARRARRRVRRRRGLRQRRQPRPGRRLRGPRAGRAVLRVHARGGADRQGRGRHGPRRERPAWSARPSTRRSRPPTSGPRRTTGWRSSTRSRTPT